MKNKIKSICYRIYNDYLMRNRYNEYEELIKNLINHQYEFITISQYDKLKEKGRHVIIRHDIDSDVKIAKKMLEIEKKYQVHTTYFFRQKTMNDTLINDIIAYGSEFGYHYEEIASFTKKNKLKSKDDILKRMPEIQEEFIDNLKNIEDKYHIEIHSIAAHGDFINRKYQITNDKLFDTDLRKKRPNIIEAYDEEIEGMLDARTSDDFGPKYWKKDSPNDMIDKKNKNILLLIHTRYWNKAPFERLKEDLGRIIEGLKNR